MDLREATSTQSRRHPWETARLWVLRRLIRDHVDLGRDPVIVDIGCGDAFVLGELAREFPHAQCYGVDDALDADGLEARQRSQPPNLRLFRQLDEVPSDRPASLILMMDVLEHIEHDQEFLSDLHHRSVADRTTQVVITVPAYRALFSAQDVFLKHFRRYTSGQLRQRLERAGFPVTSTGYFFLSLLPARILQVIAERIFPSRQQDATGLAGYSGGATMSKAMHAVLIVDAWLALLLRRTGITLPGLSIYAVCRTSA